MKSKLLALLAAGVLLTGCSTANTTVTDGNQVLMTVGNQTITKENEYQLIKRVNGPSLTLQAAQREIYKEEVGDGDDIKKEANEMYDQYAKSADNFDETLKQYGYKDKQDYMDNVIIPSVQAQKLLDKYFKDGKDAIETEFKPTLSCVIATDSEDNANKALQALKDGTSPEEVGKQYAMDGAAYTGKEQIITTQDNQLPVRLVNALNEASEPGILDEVFSDDTSTDNKTYYVAMLKSQDYDQNLDKIIEALSSNQTINSDCVVYYLTKYKFEVHDQYIFDYFKANYPQYLVTRPDLSEKSK